MVVKSGIPFTVHVAAGSTRLVVKLVLSSPGAAAVALGTVTKRAAAGTARLRLTLAAKAKLQLLKASEATLRITLRASSPRANTTTLRRALVLHG